MRRKWTLAADSAARGDTRYENPIPSRNFIAEYLRERAQLLNSEDLAYELGLREAQATDGLDRRLRAMERDGQLLCNRAGEYGLVSKMDLVKGTVLGHRDGYGFLRPDDGGDDVFLSPRTMRGAFHRDRALVRVLHGRPGDRLEGKLVEILERNTTSVVGRFFRERGAAFVYPERREISHDVMIAPDSQGDAQDGQIVVARLLEQPQGRARPVGEVVEILGESMAPGMEIEVAIRAYDLPHVWPQAVLDELKDRAPNLEAGDADGRRDLRDLPLVTIDGPDAKDFDDAVFCRRTPKGWRLWVAIADVSTYVRPGTALDTQARNRGTSVYFPGRVVPMLPELLSNGLCSLNPQRDRLAMICEMLIDDAGTVSRSSFYEAVICSQARLTYDEVALAVVERDARTRRELGDISEHLDNLYTVYHAFAGARRKRGCIEFDSHETQIVFGAESKIERVVPTLRNDAHRIIEECMIAANVSAARFLERHKASGMFRVHAAPKSDKLTALREYLGPLGLRLGGGAEPEARHYAALSRRIGDRPDARALRTMLLRSLPQARYEAGNGGHFGLALSGYAHFTSPIRRYPDLVVHRAIKHALAAPKAAHWQLPAEAIGEMAAHCSENERRADEASRDVVAWLKCEYMLDKLGERFQGTISAVTTFGLFVELDDLLVEGLVHVSTLGRDYYHFDPVHQCLRGERSGTVYTLGQRMQVQVSRVNLEERKIDFVLQSPDERKASKGHARHKQRHKRR